MDPSRIESYLRSTCSVLDFDIGELWCARKLPGQSPLLKFIQLYTSPTYEDFHSLLVQPDPSNDIMNNRDEEKHRFSPVICRGVCEGGQIVWANTRISEGLTGRIDLPLNTAVGVPICSIGHDLYILVLFAVGLISMTPSAVEYLVTVARAVAEGSNGFLSASFMSPVTPANTDHFVGLWDISELVKKYSRDVEFHLLPMGKLQKFFDCHEILLFCDLFMDFKLSRDGRFTVKQLESLRDTYRASRERSDSLSSIASKSWEIVHSTAEGAAEQGGSSSEAKGISDLKAILDATPVNEEHSSKSVDLASSGDNSSNHGVYSADLNSIDALEEAEGEDNKHNRFAKSELITALDVSNHGSGNRSVLHIYAHMTYKLSQCRFHEFMIAILGMTVFEGAELWLLSERTSELFLVAAVYRSNAMQKWITLSETLRLKMGTDVPGRVCETGRSHWDAEYSKQVAEEGKEVGVRARIAKELGVNTAFGVPLPGLRGICGTIMFYSSKADFQAEPLIVLLIERAVQLMATTSLDSSTWARLENSTLEETNSNGNGIKPSPSMTFSRWLAATEPAKTGSQPPVSQTVQTAQTGKYIISNSTTYGFAEMQGLADAQQMGGSGSSYTMVTTRRMSDFEQRLQLCKSLVNRPPNQYCGECDSEYFAEAAPIYPPVYAPPPVYPPPNLNFYPNTQNSYPTGHITTTSVPMPPQEAVVNAAYALANFGKVEWRSFLEGSNNESSTDGYNAMRLDSQRILGFYDEGQDGNLPRCKVDGCTSCVESSTSQYCVAHRSTRRCQHEGCNKCAQGATKYCIAHGGGRRCTYPNCFKGARDKFFCAAHGGGKRCTTPGCTKSAVGGGNLCTAHGGGKRCQYPDCNKSSQSNTMYCVRHGGGRSCMFQGCTKVARGRTDYCAAHGGGVRCRIANCNKLAVGSQQLCRTHNSSNKNGGSMQNDGDDGEDEDDVSMGVLSSSNPSLNKQPSNESLNAAELSNGRTKKKARMS